jgi:hypothetical protein
MASVGSKNEEASKTCIIEYYVTLFVDKYANSPKKSEVFYDKGITLNRLS